MLYRMEKSHQKDDKKQHNCVFTIVASVGFARTTETAAISFI